MKTLMIRSLGSKYRVYPLCKSFDPYCKSIGIIPLIFDMQEVGSKTLGLLGISPLIADRSKQMLGLLNLHYLPTVCCYRGNLNARGLRK